MRVPNVPRSKKKPSKNLTRMNWAANIKRNIVLEEEDQQYDPCATAVLALTLVSQVLDEASVIAHAAKDSGRPWQYVSNMEKLSIYHLYELYADDVTFTAESNGDLNDKTEVVSDSIATSTPQKAVVAIKSRNESNMIIGQGDEDFEESNTELRKSTSMIINHLFEMSDVKYENFCEESDVVIINTSSDHNDVHITTMTENMDSYDTSALNAVLRQEGQEEYPLSNCESSDITNKSSYSLLSDYADVPTDKICLNINEEIVGEKTDNGDLAQIDNENMKNDSEVAFNENAYLTLNRDYEQYSEDDEPVLQDPKTLPMQEVELLPAKASSQNLEQRQEKKKLTTAGIPTSVAGSQKSNLVRRCRIQGARLLSCFRGWWWRRKLPYRRKVPRVPGSIRGLYPISPDARRRAASLLDQRHLRTPSPSTSLVWKFNTVNEAIVHSSRWKEFGLKMSLNENDEF